MVGGRHASPATEAFGGAPHGATKRVRGVPNWTCGEQRQGWEEGGEGGEVKEEEEDEEEEEKGDESRASRWRRRMRKRVTTRMTNKTRMQWWRRTRSRRRRKRRRMRRRRRTRENPGCIIDAAIHPPVPCPLLTSPYMHSLARVGARP